MKLVLKSIFIQNPVRKVFPLKLGNQHYSLYRYRLCTKRIG